jgi:transcriptional regulator GlxA family with amidase domain
MSTNRFTLLCAALAIPLALAGCKGSKAAESDEAAEPKAAEGTSAEGAESPAPGQAPVQPIQLKEGAHNVGILIFNDLFITEFVAPFDVYKHVKDKMNVFLVAPTMDPITSYEGIVIHPHFSFASAPNIDVLVVPSGNQSMTADLEKKEYIDFVKKTAAEADYVTSHCWGAFTLAEAGVLNGKQATTFPTSTRDMAKSYANVNVVEDRRFVEDGNIITSNGGVAAFEAALAVVEKLYGKAEAEKVAAGLVFAPQNLSYARDPMKTAQLEKKK